MIDRLMRYGVVAEQLGPEPNGTILDVGSGPQGLGACLSYHFVGLDPWYPEPPIATQRAVRGSATALPFADVSFDFVLCIEVLEHIPEEKRQQIVTEMCRVARRKVIITHPYGRLARLTDHFMNVIFALLRVIGKQRPWWLAEHLLNQYPDPRKYLPAELQGWKVQIGGLENVFMHPVIAILGNVRIISKATKKFHAHYPNFAMRMVRLMNFPPYCIRVVIMEKNS